MLDVRGNFSMRKNKKRFVGQALNDRIGDLFGRQAASRNKSAGADSQSSSIRV